MGNAIQQNATKKVYSLSTVFPSTITIDLKSSMTFLIVWVENSLSPRTGMQNTADTLKWLPFKAIQTLK